MTLSDRLISRPECFEDPGLRAALYDPSDRRPTIIICAAILRDGKIWTGRRHCDIITAVFEDTGFAVKSAEQGFLTDSGCFLSRHSARALARVSGQVAPTFDKVLTSEDLW